jgi:hypothetical protein
MSQTNSGTSNGAENTLVILRALARDYNSGQDVPTTLAKRLVRDSAGTLRAEVTLGSMPLYVRATEVAFSNFDSFASLLNAAVEADGAVIHGEIIPGMNTRRMRRLLVADGDSPATIRDRLCPYIVLDIDQLPLPKGLSVEKDPDAVIEFVRAVLPDELRDTSFWYHHSHSAGTTRKVKLHLVFLLQEPRSCKDLARWVKRQNEVLGLPLFDPAPYSPNDFIFIGNPLLDHNVEDPVPPGKRFGVCPGSRDTALLNIPDTWRPTEERRNREQQGDIRSITGVGVEGIAAQLKRLGPECHGAIVGAVNAAFRQRGLLVDDTELEARIIRAIETADWSLSTRSEDYIAGEVSRISSVISWRRGIEETLIRETLFGVPAPKYETAAKATAALGNALDEFFIRCEAWRDTCAAKEEAVDTPPAPLMAVRATTGLGKTRGVVARLLDAPFRAILYVAPTHEVLEEIKKALEREQDDRRSSAGKRWEIIHVYGRTHKDPKTGEPTMCKRADVADKVRRHGGDVGKLLCGTADEPKCLHYDTCPFIEQRDHLRATKEDDGVATITLVATDTLKHSLPGGVRTPDLVVIDEAFWSSLVSVRYAEPRGHLKLETMRGLRWRAFENKKDDVGNVVAQRHAAAASAALNKLWRRFVKLFDGCESDTDGGGFFLVSALAMGAVDLAKLQKSLGRCRVNVELALGGSLDDAHLLSALSKVAEINERVGVYQNLIGAVLVEKARVGAVRSAMISIEDGYVLFRRAGEPRALGSEDKRRVTPTLFLDADLDGEIVRRWWPGLAEEEIVDVTCEWSPNVKVVHIKGRSFSKSWALGRKGANTKEQKRAARHRRDLDSFIRQCMALNDVDTSQTMVVSYKDLITALDSQSQDDLYSVPENPAEWRSAGWFNALAGSDRWRDVRLGFVIGRPQATPKAYSDLARAIWGHEGSDWRDVEVDSKGFLDPPRRRFRLHTREGVAPATVRTEVMPDPRSDRIYRAVTWGQPMQADGRVRPVYRTEKHPCVLFTMGEVPRGMKVDAVVHWDDVIPVRFDQAVVRAIDTGGVIPSSAGALAKFAPDLWKSKKAVEKDCRLQVDDDSVTLDLQDKLASAVRKVMVLAGARLGEKRPLHAIEWSSSTKGVLSVDTAPDGTPIHGAGGEVRTAGQRGSPSRWIRVPCRSAATLSAGLTAAFGSAVTQVRIDGGEWLTIGQLRDLETQARWYENAHRAWFKHGVVPPLPWERLPAVLSPGARLRMEVAEARLERGLRDAAVDLAPDVRLSVVYCESGAAMLWAAGGEQAG